MRYEVTIKCSAPTKPEPMTDRIWQANIARLGFVVGGHWAMSPRTLRTFLMIEGEGKVLDGFSYRHREASWAIERALRAWRTELTLLLGAEEHDWPFDLRVSAEPYC